MKIQETGDRGKGLRGLRFGADQETEYSPPRKEFGAGSGHEAHEYSEHEIKPQIHTDARRSKGHEERGGEGGWKTKTGDRSQNSGARSDEVGAGRHRQAEVKFPAVETACGVKIGAGSGTKDTKQTGAVGRPAPN